MPEVGDRVSLTSKGVPRLGLVIATQATMLRVRWDSGEETSLFPGPGTVRVVGKSRKRASIPTAASTRTASRPAPTKATVKSSAPVKKAPAKSTAKSSTRKAAAGTSQATKKAATSSTTKASSKKAAAAKASGRKSR